MCLNMPVNLSALNHGPLATLLTWETISINKHMFAKLWLYHHVD